MWVSVGPFFASTMPFLDVCTPPSSTSAAAKLDTEVYINEQLREQYRQYPEKTKSVAFKLCPLQTVLVHDWPRFEIPSTAAVVTTDKQLPTIFHEPSTTAVNPV